MSLQAEFAALLAARGGPASGSAQDVVRGATMPAARMSGESKSLPGASGPLDGAADAGARVNDGRPWAPCGGIHGGVSGHAGGLFGGASLK